MGNLIINNSQPIDETLLQNGVFMILSDIDKVPPHIWISAFSRIFSIDINGFTANRQVHTLLKVFKQKRTQAMFFELNIPNLSPKYLIRILNQIVYQLEKVKYDSVTCLDPIKKFCNTCYGLNTNTVKTIFDLMPILEEKRVIKSTYAYNIQTSKLIIPEYEFYHVNERILSLQ